MSFGEDLQGSGVLQQTFGQADTYVYSGKEQDGDTWAPTFVYHGFRYAR